MAKRASKSKGLETKDFLAHIATLNKGKNLDVHLRRSKASGSAKLKVRVRPVAVRQVRAS